MIIAILLYKLFRQYNLSRMTTNVRASDMVARFGGGTGENVVEWLKKVELVAKLQKIEDLAKFVPLFLEHAAFSVYDQLPEVKKHV